MKRLSLFFAATLIAAMSFAQSMTRTVATVEKLWSYPSPGAGVARQGFGMDSALYYHKHGDGVYKVNSATATPELILSAAKSGISNPAVAKDDVGNIVVFGAATFPTSATQDNFFYVLPKGDTIGTKSASPVLDGFSRADFIAADGNLVSAEGGHVYVTLSNAQGCYDVLFQNGAPVSVVKFAGMTLSGTQSCVMMKEGNLYLYTAAGLGVYQYDGTTSTAIAGLTDLNNQCVGATKFYAAGKEFYVYHTGANYTSQISVFNKTDGVFAQDATGGVNFILNNNTASAGALRGVWTNVEKIDDNNYLLYAWHSHDGGAVFKITVSQASYCYIKQGNAGAEWISMDAREGGYVYEGIYMADSLYINGAADAEGATKFTRANINYTGEVAVNDTVRFIYNDSTNAMSVVLLGKYVPKMTFNVKVPAGTLNCYVAGNFTDPQWAIFMPMTPVTDSTFTLTVTGAGVANAAAVEYKYTCGTSWDYVEKGPNGEELNNRHWAENDVVASWASMPVVNVISYVLNDGVTNAYGWVDKGEMFDSFMSDAEALEGYKTLDEFLAMPEKLGDPGICKYLNNPEKAFADTVKWGWLKSYIEKVHIAQADEGASALPANGAGAAWRYAIGAFFIDGQRTGWPKSANFASCGVSTVPAYQSTWKGGFDNESILRAGETFVLNTPYKEGYTFDGWYASADFSGNKVISINDSTPTCTLYAKWIEYIPTIAEALAADSAANVKLGGVVTFVRGTKNVYVQDATGGVLLYTKTNATCQPGDFVVVTGKNDMYGGAPEISSAEIVRSEAGHALPAEVTTTIATLLSNPLKYFCQRVYVEGVNIAKYDSKGNAYVTDGVDTVQCYYVTLDQTAFPVGTKVNLHLIAAYFNGFQFVGPVSGVEAASASGLDPFAYPALGENGVYTLTNKWLYTNVMDNYSDNAPGAPDQSRGMVAKDGKMYFINNKGGSAGVKGTGRILVVDGATGVMLDPINIVDDHLFETADSTGAYSFSATLSFNDLKLDNAGHFLMGGCVSGRQPVQIYKLDIATGVATEIINERLVDNEEWGQQLDTATTKWRFDAFNVYGDVDGNAIIMAADANSFYAYKWTIENGVAGRAERINCTPEPTDVSLIVKDGGLTVGAFGTAPQIFPVDFNYFYVDGWNTLPMLFDMDGTLMEDFATCPTGVAVPMAGADTCTMNMGHNGLCEFQIGDEYFLVMAATNTVGKPTSAFVVYKFADAAKSFAEIEPMWYFPKAGMGAATNGCRTAVPSVEVNGTKATLYVYTNNNGYGVYEMTGKEGTGIKNIEGNAEVLKKVENGQVYIIKNGVTYTVLGTVVRK